MSERGPGHRYSARTRRRARRLYRQHAWTLARISRDLDVPVGTLRSWISDLNPCTGNARRYDRRRILAQVRDGASRQEIMQEHGCSARWLSDLLSGKLDTKPPQGEEGNNTSC